MSETCSKCGAVFEICELKEINRDKDSLQLKFCGETLLEWNGSTFYLIKEVIKEPRKTE